MVVSSTMKDTEPTSTTALYQEDKNDQNYAYYEDFDHQETATPTSETDNKLMTTANKSSSENGFEDYLEATVGSTESSTIATSSGTRRKETSDSINETQVRNSAGQEDGDDEDYEDYENYGGNDNYHYYEANDYQAKKTTVQTNSMIYTTTNYATSTQSEDPITSQVTSDPIFQTSNESSYISMQNYTETSDWNDNKSFEYEQNENLKEKVQSDDYAYYAGYGIENEELTTSKPLTEKMSTASDEEKFEQNTYDAKVSASYDDSYNRNYSYDYNTYY